MSLGAKDNRFAIIALRCMKPSYAMVDEAVLAPVRLID